MDSTCRLLVLSLLQIKGSYCGNGSGGSAVPRAHAGLLGQDATFPFHDGARPRAANLLAKSSSWGAKRSYGPTRQLPLYHRSHSPCVDGTLSAGAFLRFCEPGRVQSCVRPPGSVCITAGPHAVGFGLQGVGVPAGAPAAGARGADVPGLSGPGTAATGGRSSGQALGTGPSRGDGAGGGTGLGNPGNASNVGRAGESPGPGDFGISALGKK